MRLSAPLWQRLSSGIEASLEVAEIAANPQLQAEARASAPMLERLAQPCGPQAVMQALAPLVTVFGISDAARAPGFWEVYVKTLASLPREALDRAVDEYPAHGKFFPKPAEIRELADRHAAVIRKAATRARTAANVKPEREREPKTPEQIAAVRRLLSEFTATMEAKSPAKPEPRRHRVGESVDERGLTPSMRKWLEGRAA